MNKFTDVIGRTSKMCKRTMVGILLTVAMVGIGVVSNDLTAYANNTVMGSATETADNTYMMINNTEQVAGVSNDTRLNTKQGFTVNVEFCMTPGSELHADGIALMFTEEKGVLGDSGLNLGILRKETTYAVEVDTYYSALGIENPGDPDYEHIGIVQDNHSHHLATRPCSVTDGEWHTLTVKGSQKKLVVYLDGIKIMTNTSVTLPQYVYTTVTASSGAHYSITTVKNFSVIQEKSKLQKPVIKVKSKNGKVTISWNHINSTKKYEIYRATKKNGKYKKIKTVKAISYTDKKVKSNKTYYYKVRAIASDSKYNSKFSKIKKVRVK